MYHSTCFASSRPHGTGTNSSHTSHALAPFESVSLEVPLDKFKIDCIMPGDDKKKLAVEIVVGNPVEKIKRLMFKEKGLSAVEVYLTHLKH